MRSVLTGPHECGEKTKVDKKKSYTAENPHACGEKCLSDVCSSTYGGESPRTRGER